MGITLQIKRTTGTNAPGTLANGELAYSHGAATQGNNGKRLFVGDAANSVTVVGGQYFTDMLDHPLGTLTGSSAIITDATSKVDTIKLKGANNTTTGNIVLDNNDSSYATTLKGANVGSDINITLPNTAGTVITTGNKTDITGSIGALDDLSVDNIRLGVADAQTISTSSGVLKLNPATHIDAVSNRIINVAAPQDSNDAANKGYVDGLIQGLDVKGSVRTATTSSDATNSLSTDYANGQTIGGVTLATGDRVLIKNHNTGSENGVYTVNASGAPTRATDFDSNAGISAGAFVFVEEGTNADQGFVLTNNGTVTIGSTSLVFTQFSGAGNISAGNGLQQSGTVLSVKLDGAGIASGLASGQAGLSIAPGGVTDAMMAANSVDLASTTVNNSLTVDHGGTGLSAIPQGSILVANTANTITALDGVVEVDGGSNTANDKFLLYNGTSDTLGFTHSLDGGTYP